MAALIWGRTTMAEDDSFNDVLEVTLNTSSQLWSDLIQQKEESLKCLTNTSFFFKFSLDRVTHVSPWLNWWSGLWSLWSGFCLDCVCDQRGKRTNVISWPNWILGMKETWRQGHAGSRTSCKKGAESRCDSFMKLVCLFTGLKDGVNHNRAWACDGQQRRGPFVFCFVFVSLSHLSAVSVRMQSF